MAVSVFSAVCGVVVEGDGFFCSIGGAREVAGVVLEGKFDIGAEGEVAVFTS